MTLHRSLTAASALLLFTNPSHALPEGPMIIQDGGLPRSFELDTAELGLRQADGKWRLEKSGAATAAQLSGALALRSTRAAAAERVDAVLYQTGVPRTEFSRRWVTGEVIVHLQPGAEAAAIAARTGAGGVKPLPLLPGAHLFTFTAPGASLEALPALRALPGVLSAEPVLARQQKRRWTPDDPYFAYSAANPGYQWHLRNTQGLVGIDINVTGVWDTWRGAGIRIGIMDDGLQVSHPDLSANCDTANDYDWNGGDTDPSPGTGDNHGTSCAGVAAGRGNNGIGITGAAPEATLVGMRLISSLSTDTTESAALLHRSDIIQVKSNSWGPDDDGATIEGPGTQTAAAFASATSSGRGGLGTIITWAGGNGLASGDDCNFDGYANSIHVIATGALNNTGTQSWYSESGANLLITTPSDGGDGITTVDLTGATGYNSGGGGNFTDAAYTNDFGGTSSACPLAAGGIALLLESKPSLGWRDVKEILLRTATKVDATDPGWFTSAAGFHWNDKYGAGLLNIGAAVTLAASWINLGPMLTTSATVTPVAAIPDNSSAGATATFNIGTALRAEQAALAVNISHTRRGQLEIYLTSPSGTVSKLARSRPDTSSGLTWTFTTPQFWGESTAGTWTLRAVDTASGQTGTLNSATLTLYGTSTSPAPAITSASSASGATGVPFSFQATAINSPTSWSATGLPPGFNISTSGLITGTSAAAGTWTASLSATNSFGTGTAPLTISIIAPPPPFADAVETPGRSYAQSATPWFSQNTTTHDNADAAQSGLIANSASTYFETTVTGPATVSFWWRTDSEADYDWLRFTVNGAEPFSGISGNTIWAHITHILPAGSHVLRWTYSKDTSVSEGADAAWVDEISITLPTAISLTAAGRSTGFQEPPLNVATWTRPTVGGTELGWTSTGGRVAEAGNRTPPASGPIVGGTTGVKSFLLNNASATLRTEPVDLTGFTAVRGEADVRAFTTNTNNFETTDNLRIHLEVSTDLVSWTAGPDILPLRTGGTPDQLIALNTASVTTYQHFASTALPAGTRYARITVTGVNNSNNENLVIDNLRLSGTPLNADADGDGFTADIEAHFGTSDASFSSAPLAVFQPPGGLGTFTFPSVAGNSYVVEVSTDLVTWTPQNVTATGNLTTWTDAAAPAAAKRYYRVRKP